MLMETRQPTHSPVLLQHLFLGVLAFLTIKHRLIPTLEKQGWQVGCVLKSLCLKPALPKLPGYCPGNSMHNPYHPWTTVAGTGGYIHTWGLKEKRVQEGTWLRKTSVDPSRSQWGFCREISDSVHPQWGKGLLQIAVAKLTFPFPSTPP